MNPPFQIIFMLKKITLLFILSQFIGLTAVLFNPIKIFILGFPYTFFYIDRRLYDETYNQYGTNPTYLFINFSIFIIVYLVFSTKLRSAMFNFWRKK